MEVVSFDDDQPILKFIAVDNGLSKHTVSSKLEVRQVLLHNSKTTLSWSILDESERLQMLKLQITVIFILHGNLTLIMSSLTQKNKILIDRY